LSSPSHRQDSNLNNLRPSPGSLKCQLSDVPTLVRWDSVWQLWYAGKNDLDHQVRCTAAFCPPFAHLLPTFYPPSAHLLPTFCPPSAPLSTHLLPTFCPPPLLLLLLLLLLRPPLMHAPLHGSCIAPACYSGPLKPTNHRTLPCLATTLPYLASPCPTQVVRLSSQDVPTAYAFELEAATIVQSSQVVDAVEKMCGVPVAV
jgi:hypothetical protein